MTSFQVSQGLCFVNGVLVDPHMYAGAPGAVNDSSQEQVHKVGPLPRGIYAIGDPIDDQHMGRYCLPLTALPGTDTFGRSGFFIHGRNAKKDVNGQRASSEGCPVATDLDVRERIYADPDRRIFVTD